MKMHVLLSKISLHNQSLFCVLSNHCLNDTLVLTNGKDKIKCSHNNFRRYALISFKVCRMAKHCKIQFRSDFKYHK